MVERAVTLTDEELDELERYSERAGEQQAVALRHAALKGLRELRIEQGIDAYTRGEASQVAAEIAGLPRGVFLQTLVERGVVFLEGPPSLVQQFKDLAGLLGNDRLAVVASELAERRG